MEKLTRPAGPAEPTGDRSGQEAEQAGKERESTRPVKMLRDSQKQLSQATYDCKDLNTIIVLSSYFRIHSYR